MYYKECKENNTKSTTVTATIAKDTNTETKKKVKSSSSNNNNNKSLENDKYKVNTNANTNSINKQNEELNYYIIINIINDCLKLPEGKLINSKYKKKALKWQAYCADSTATNTTNKDDNYSNTTTNSNNKDNNGIINEWLVSDINIKGSLTLIDPSGQHDSVLEEYCVADSTIRGEIKIEYMKDEIVIIRLDSRNKFIGFYVQSEEG